MPIASVIQSARAAFRWAFACFAILALVAARPAAAQDTLRVDLAALKARGDTLPIRPGDWVVLLKNLVPRFNYASTSATTNKPVTPFEKPAGFQPLALISPCSAFETSLKKLVEAFDKLEREEEVPALATRADAEVKAASQASCQAATQLWIGAVLERVHATTAVQRVIPVKDNEYLTVAVRRSTPDGKEPRAWEVVYVTPTTGGWRTMFGFAALQTGGLGKSGVFENTRRYFTDPVPNATDRFVIKEGRGPQLDLVPVMALTYQTAPERGVNLIPNVSAGLGLDLSNPFVTLGVGWTFYSNLHVGLGIAARREEILGTSYHVGDTVRTALTVEQLMPVRDFRLRPMVSLSFRFASNPFAAAKGGSATDGKTPAKDSGGNATVSTPPAPGSTPPAAGGAGSGTPQKPAPPPDGSTDRNRH